MLGTRGHDGAVYIYTTYIYTFTYTVMSGFLFFSFFVFFV